MAQHYLPGLSFSPMRSTPASLPGYFQVLFPPIDPHVSKKNGVAIKSPLDDILASGS
jgi:hypothetical protein